MQAAMRRCHAMHKNGDSRANSGMLVAATAAGGHAARRRSGRAGHLALPDQPQEVAELLSPRGQPVQP